MLVARQIPVVFYKQAAAGHVAVGYLFARTVEFSHVGNQGFRQPGARVFGEHAVALIAFKAVSAAEISAFAPVAVGNQAVGNIGFEGGGEQ